MAWADIVPRERDRLSNLRMDCIQSKDYSLLMWEAQRYGMAYNTLWRRLQEHAAAKPKFIFKDDRRPNWTNWLRAETSNALFISDLEVPDHSEELLSYANTVAKVYSLDTIIWAGDINAQDETGVSTHEHSWEYQRPTLTESIGITRRIFTEFKDSAPNQYFITGNHDERVAKALSGQAGFDMYFPDFNIKFSKYPYMYLNTSRGLVKVTHPKRSFSENAINLGRNIINKNRIKSHLIMAHTHQGQRGHSKDGMYEIIALGCMRDPDKTQYKNTDDNTFGEWQPGFAMMLNGYFYMLNLYSTDWKRVLRGEGIA